MEIVSGSLFYHDGSGSLYVPNRVALHNGWGKGRSSHVVGDDLKPLPNRLSITFFSYTEDQFYRGKFDLPYDKILELFQTGFYSPNEGGQITYDVIVVGVAPGGVVAVWLWGINRRTEVFFGEAEKVEGDWKRIINNPDITREEFIRSEIEEILKTPEAVAELKKNGVPFGRWHRYHQRYHWQPRFNGLVPRDDRIDIVEYYNGERDYLDYPLEASIAASTRAVPSKIDFTWNRTGRLVNDVVIRSSFDKTEILTAFEKLGKDGQPLQLELRLEPEKNYDFTIWLSSDKELIHLEKTQVKTYKPGGMRYKNAGPEDTE
ncbi:MAG: DUF2931 family protein [Planctomycetaceae bacterium]|nr:DUF2931 family protein [Planctomycetaceae bacterium]